MMESIQTVRKLVDQGALLEAWHALVRIASADDDFTAQHKYARLFFRILPGIQCLVPLRVSIAASSTVDHFSDILRFWMAAAGFDARINIAAFDTIDQSILDSDNGIYAYKPDIIWIFTSYRDVKTQVPLGASWSEVDEKVREAFARYETLWEAIARNCGAHILQNNADLPVHRVFGNYECQAAWSLRNICQTFNRELASHAPSGVTVFDMDYISSLFGKREWCDDRYWFHSKHSFSLNASGLVAFQAAKVLRALRGHAKKCIVLDLDNTLWGGVIGDDGVSGIRLGQGADGEAFVDFQRYLLALKNRGIILAVCSKNEDTTARLPFIQHPDMILKESDIAMFLANWNNKVDNIREIARILDIGLDSMVFLDDNPAERALVREFLPSVVVPDMPQDPSDYVRFLDACSFFETVGFSKEDQSRSSMYRDNALRLRLKDSHTDIGTYLRSLNMIAVAAPFDDFHIPRIAQLINKSNQFHLTTTRYTEADLRVLLTSRDVAGLFFKLRDRFGDNGLISAVILRHHHDTEWLLDTWVMSCRVLSRTMEQFVQNAVVEFARLKGATALLGRFIPTSKNGLVREHYNNLGYQRLPDSDGASWWHLSLLDSPPRVETYVEWETTTRWEERKETE